MDLSLIYQLPADSAVTTTADEAAGVRLRCCESTDIDDEARRYANAHLSSCALEYRKLFGERPSATLRTAHARREGSPGVVDRLDGP